LSAAYFRGEQDIENGSVNLWVTAWGYTPGDTDIDSLILYYSKSAEAYAGNDTTIFADEVLQLNATAANYDSVSWSTSGDGIFSDNSIVNPIYTPGPEDIQNGSLWLTIDAFASAPCTGDATDQLKLTIDEVVGIQEIQHELNITVVPNPTDGIFTFNISQIEEKENIKISVSDISGKTLFTQQLTEIQSGHYQNSFNLTYLPKGIYILSVSGDDYRINKKVVLQ